MFITLAVFAQAARRDLEYAEAIAARFPDGSALGVARDKAEEEHAVAVAVIGARFSCCETVALECFKPWSASVTCLVVHPLIAP